MDRCALNLRALETRPIEVFAINRADSTGRAEDGVCEVLKVHYQQGEERTFKHPLHPDHHPVLDRVDSPSRFSNLFSTGSM